MREKRACAAIGGVRRRMAVPMLGTHDGRAIQKDDEGVEIAVIEGQQMSSTTLST
jgi:hypothetical protein